MKIQPVGPNQTQLVIGDLTVFFSYETPVAAQSAKLGWIRDAHKYSKTTSRHVNKWLDGITARELSTETFRAEIEREMSRFAAPRLEGGR